ncbi:MAG TPA: ATP-binding protein [Thermoanaerobaculia bacterium]|jgi:nitrogen fixation/metabolism regulation signal transduction histidine kinase|nr:ATP-binding protein [Thermoanaerobaculia bacterium]
MRLRAKITLYVIALHAVLAGAATFILIERPMLLFAVEAAFVVSVIVSIRLVAALFVPIDLLQTGAELIAERDFTSRLVPVGQPEMDVLIDVYNRMIDRLREERLAAEEQGQLLQKIVEASPAAIVICDFEGQIEQRNPAAIRMLGNEPLPEIASGESRLVFSRGARRLKVSRAEFRDRGFVKTFYVIEEMTEELRLTEKTAYEKLIRMMSHEVNNSVGAVRSLLESSLRYAPQIGDADRDDFTNALTIASTRIDALNRFMAAFADVVRIPPPHRTPSRVDELVARVAALLRPELEDRRIAVTLALDDRGAYNIDVSQIEQVVLNIFRNAIEATGRDGAIRASFVDGVLMIADSGPGIAESIRSELFTPFFTTKRDGRGLGLTIVQEILANHGFAYSLANGEGGGGEFRIVLR